MELEDLDNELWLKDYKKKRRAHIQEIVDASMLSEQEKEWMKEYASQSAKDITYGKENRHVERIIMPNFFDKRRNDHMWYILKIKNYKIYHERNSNYYGTF